VLLAAYRAASQVISYLISKRMDDPNMYVWPELDAGGPIDHDTIAPRARSRCRHGPRARAGRGRRTGQRQGLSFWCGARPGRYGRSDRGESRPAGAAARPGRQARGPPGAHRFHCVGLAGPLPRRQGGAAGSLPSLRLGRAALLDAAEESARRGSACGRGVPRQPRGTITSCTWALRRALARQQAAGSV